MRPEILDLRTRFFTVRLRISNGAKRMSTTAVVSLEIPIPSMVGGAPFGSPIPQVTDDAGTPFTVVVIPVDDELAVKPR